MFIKFFKHDLEYGILHSKKRLIVTFVGFFLLAIYHFWNIRIYQLNAPEYFEYPVTTTDYFLTLAGGCGKVTFFSGTDSDFSMPTMWFMFILWIQFVSLYYPFSELNGIGKQLMVLSGSRGVWWLSKCAWTAINAALSYVMIFVSSTLAGLVCGAKLSFNANYYLYRELNMNIDDLTSNTTWNAFSVVMMIGFTVIVLALLQLLLSLLIKPLFSYFLLAGYFFAGAYIQHPSLFANYAMAARSSVLVTTGLDASLGVLIGVWIAALSVLIGYYVFQKRDILGNDLA